MSGCSTSRFSTSIGVNYSRNTNDAQFFGNFTDDAGATHHTFAHLEQETLGLTWRLGYTFSPTASLQVYAQPFVSRGEYSDIREVADAGAAEYADRFQPYTDPAVKTPDAREATNPDNLVCRAVRAIRAAHPDPVVLSAGLYRPHTRPGRAWLEAPRSPWYPRSLSRSTTSPI